MADRLPLLFFPEAKSVLPLAGSPFPPPQMQFPSHERQAARVRSQLERIEEHFTRYTTSINSSIEGMEPESVLVIEIAGSLEDFRQAIEAIDGLEWLGEWEVDNIEPDADLFLRPKVGPEFFCSKRPEIITKDQSREIFRLLQDQRIIDNHGYFIPDKYSSLSLPDNLKTLTDIIASIIDEAKKKPISGRLFLSYTNQTGMKELLSLWEQWETGERFDRGRTKWRDLFNKIYRIRPWGIEETLRETGMIGRWQDLVAPIKPEENVTFQIDLFYRKNANDRRKNEHIIRQLLSCLGGDVLGPFMDQKDIAFHAVKAQLPAGQIQRLLEELKTSDKNVDISLFIFTGIMFFRPTGQCIASSPEETGVEAELLEMATRLPPVAAILDGVPSLLHVALRDQLLFDDPDNLSGTYQPGERRHGTSIASLVLHGDLAGEESRKTQLQYKVYFLPVMQVDPKTRGWPGRDVLERFPDEVFYEDRIERAVRRMFEGEGEVPPQAPTVKIINLSLGDPDRPFFHILSPWAKLLDYLSFKYHVLFCVSAGNYENEIDLGLLMSEFEKLSEDKRAEVYIKNVERHLSDRRLIAPAESMNALTIGASHWDESGEYLAGKRVDLQPYTNLFSPVSRLGHGFRRSIKPELFFPGGRQLFSERFPNGSSYSVAAATSKPGQQVALDSAREGELSRTVFTRGTSNATALATRSGIRICEMLSSLRMETGAPIPDSLVSVLTKTLMVHGASHDKGAEGILSATLKTKESAGRLKEELSRYMGYGSIDIERVLACAEQRATVLGCGEILANEVHEYRFPLPPALAGERTPRKMVVTLAWFSPINPFNRNLREAKLVVEPTESWSSVPLNINRKSNDWQQVQRGTVQHEILEGETAVSAYRDGDVILLRVSCKADATEKLDQKIPYGLAVTLEVEESVTLPIYIQIRDRIRLREQVGVGYGRSGEST